MGHRWHTIGPPRCQGAFLQVRIGRTSTDDSLDRLVAFARDVAAAPLADDLAARTALLLVDEMAALLAAASDPRMLAVRDGLLPAGVATAEDAAVATAVALSWMELDEGFTRASCHGGLYLLPVLMTVAAERDSTLGEILSRLAAGYEVLARLAAAYRIARFTWHPHAIWAPVGAALAAALSRGSDQGTTMAALRGAASLAMLGGYEAATDGAEIRNVWGAIGTRNGLAAHRLAELGVDGPAAAPGAVLERLNGTAGAPDVLTADLGTRWAVFDTFVKEHACCQSMHSAIDAALALPALPADAIAQVEIATPRLEMNEVAPMNRLAAQFSLPHAMAVSLLFGDADAPRFREDTIADPRVAALRERVVLSPWPEPLEGPNARPARVTVTLRDGTERAETRLSARRLTDADRTAVVAMKLRRYGEGTGAVAACEALLTDVGGALSRPWRDFAAACFDAPQGAPSPAEAAQ
ncbi:MmgE/PrpD family protein [Acuticoccus mangrovi]|uniref:MmgE/PrpD family protein n=1 Tax=Acuticoccus mangrovi TaxID=2796142 RepID=A0A934MI97_9HYPH|nr:MmgE/PrpD family protein [Acuticoccus mangrovi]MBJ3778528.1 MmgE/PrpD family protein [Acuticoccus mangrovi]